MSGRLNGKTAVVTGAGRGIGAAIAKLFAAEGAVVACVSRTEANSERTRAEIVEAGGKAGAFAVDVANASESEAVFERISKELGPVTVLVNNAGITRDGLLVRMSEADWDAVIDTNLKAAFLWTKLAARGMMKARHGRIIHISSVVGLMGNAGQANYAASKAGLIGLSRSVARELASRNVTSNVVAPGFIVSDMTGALPEETRKKVLEEIPAGAFGEAVDVAEAALFLAAESGRYITGQVLAVDGGLAM